LEEGKRRNVITVGDTHGSVHSFMRLLEELKNRGLLFEDLSLHPNTLLVETGDFCDRGNYDTELLYVLMHIFLKNPGKVFLLRGNHEAYIPGFLLVPFASVFSKYSTDKYKSEFLTFCRNCGDLKNLIGQEEYEGLLGIEDEQKRSEGFVKLLKQKMIDALPSALYLGTPQYLFLFAHGGIAQDYDPTSLLNADYVSGIICFQDIKKEERESSRSQSSRTFTSPPLLRSKRFTPPPLTRSGGEDIKATFEGSDFEYKEKGDSFYPTYGRGGSSACVNLRDLNEILGGKWGGEGKVKFVFGGHQHNPHVASFFQITEGSKVELVPIKSRIRLSDHKGFPVFKLMSAPEGLAMDEEGFVVIGMEGNLFTKCGVSVFSRELPEVQTRNGKFVHGKKEGLKWKYEWKDEPQVEKLQKSEPQKEGQSVSVTTTVV
jgi:hypothetical protein